LPVLVALAIVISFIVTRNGPAMVFIFLLFWILFVFSIITIQLRRTAEGFAHYIGLVVARAFS
jgi:hypothetical protein